jgi:hypothetical protein
MEWQAKKEWWLTCQSTRTPCDLAPLRGFSLGAGYFHVMRSDVRSSVPRHKLDLEAAESATQLAFAEIEPIVPALLEWLQDPNWPVAHVIAPYFAKVGEPLAPFVRRIFDGADGGWKYSLIYSVVMESRNLCAALESDLRRLADEPTADDEKEEVNLAAAEALAWLAN